jgi:hypothetical protein
VNKLTNLIAKHSTKLEVLQSKLSNDVQKFVNAFCDKYQISFVTGMGTWAFYFGERENAYRADYIDDEFLEQIDRELMQALKYDFGCSNNIIDLGDCLTDYTVSCDDFVYIRDDDETLSLVEPSDYDTHKNIDDEEDENLFRFYDARFYKMSRIMANQILSSVSYIDMRKWN